MILRRVFFLIFLITINCFNSDNPFSKHPAFIDKQLRQNFLNALLFVATLNGDSETIKITLKENANIDYQNQENEICISINPKYKKYWMIYFAVLSGKIRSIDFKNDAYALQFGEPLEISQLLLQIRSHVNNRANFKGLLSGLTPLMVSAILADKETLVTLLNAGANADIINDEGGHRTAYDYACYFKRHDIKKILKIYKKKYLPYKNANIKGLKIKNNSLPNDLWEIVIDYYEMLDFIQFLEAWESKHKKSRKHCIVQ